MSSAKWGVSNALAVTCNNECRTISTFTFLLHRKKKKLVEQYEDSVRLNTPTHGIEMDDKRKQVPSLYRLSSTTTANAAAANSLVLSCNERNIKRKLHGTKHEEEHPQILIDGNDNNLVDELVEDHSDSEYRNDQRHEIRESKNSTSRTRYRLTTFSLRSMIDGGVQSKFNITCLLCKRRFACSDTSSTFLAYYICGDCMENEKGHAKELAAALLNNDKARLVSTGCASEDLSAYDYCKCQNCVRRQLVVEERRKEIEVLQRCWHDLRQNIRQMFRDGLNANMTSSKGKRFDVDKIKRNVTILAEKDPHQLYKRLESIGHEYVMNLKSDDLWQILVAPQVVPALIQLYEAGASEEQMELERAKLLSKLCLIAFLANKKLRGICHHY
ncbi:hypothetical protein DINM_021105 [Dirofilaria immitis]|nr:hypothetical protein [Dirofilaria immitis]